MPGRLAVLKKNRLYQAAYVALIALVSGKLERFKNSLIESKGSGTSRHGGHYEHCFKYTTATS